MVEGRLPQRSGSGVGVTSPLHSLTSTASFVTDISMGAVIQFLWSFQGTFRIERRDLCNSTWKQTS